MLRWISTGAVIGIFAVACSGDDGSEGAAGSAGKGGTPAGGSGGKDAATTGGSGGSVAGSGGGAGTGGQSGSGGASGSGGSSGTSGGTSGSAGSSGTDSGVDAGGTAGDASSCTSPSGKGPCDTIPQCGCTSGQNCDVTGTDGTTACVSAGTVSPWYGCSGVGQCQTGYTCVVGVCHPFCEDATSTCPGTDATCSQATIGSTAVPGYFVCSRTCSPVDPSLDDAVFDPCGPGLGCYPSMTHDSDCLGPTTASGTQGVDCADLSGNADLTLCAPGYFCDVTSLTCLKFCLMSSSYCPVNTSCSNFTPVLYAGSESIGYCS